MRILLHDMNLPVAASAWPPVIQTAIGAVAAIAGGAFTQWFTWQKERRALAAAFAGEIQSVVKAQNFRNLQAMIKQGKVPSAQPSFPVFDANVGKIGMLPVDLAGRVSVFYSDLAGVYLDLRTLYEALIERKIQIENPEEIKTGLLKRLPTLESEANSLVANLRKESKRKWRM